ncbi:MAG: M90 family metallopeptidase [Cyanobacterium sp.]
MTDIYLIIVILLIMAFSYVILALNTNKKRKLIYSSPINKNWLTFLDQNVYLYQKLPNKYKQQLQNYIKIFIAEKDFIGKDGVEVTDEMKLTIASQACLLLIENNPNFLHPNRSNYFPYLKYIYIYPGIIQKKHRKNSSENHLLLGQSSVGHKSGKDGDILLSWADVQLESQSPNARGNVVLHEFSHQLDQEFGNATGTPRLKNLEATLIWQNIFKMEYQKLCLSTQVQEPTIIDKYGATNPVEFFAVATETFFIKGKLMAVNHPLLYEQLRQYYQLNPAVW